jgi:cytochrome c biogenesis protein CcdA
MANRKARRAAMLVDKLLTRKGWRVIAHSLLAAAGISLVYLLSGMVIQNIQHGTLSWWILGVAITISLWLVALGSILVKAELTDWR